MTANTMTTISAVKTIFATGMSLRKPAWSLGKPVMLALKLCALMNGTVYSRILAIIAGVSEGIGRHCMTKNQNNFVAWLDRTGINATARLLKIDPSSVSRWRNGITLPIPEHIQKLLDLCNGAFDLKDILRNHHGTKKSS